MKKGVISVSWTLGLGRHERREVKGWGGKIIGVWERGTDIYAVTHLESGQKIADVAVYDDLPKKQRLKLIIEAVEQADKPELWETCESLNASSVSVWQRHHTEKWEAERTTYVEIFALNRDAEIEIEIYKFSRAINTIIDFSKQ